MGCVFKILQGRWLSLTNSSGCWELLNILGDLSSPPRDSDVVTAVLDAGVAAQCMLAIQAQICCLHLACELHGPPASVDEPLTSAHFSPFLSPHSLPLFVTT